MSTARVHSDIFVNEIRRIHGWSGEYGDYKAKLGGPSKQVSKSSVAKSKAPGRVRQPEEVMLALNASVARAGDSVDKIVSVLCEDLEVNDDVPVLVLSTDVSLVCTLEQVERNPYLDEVFPVTVDQQCIEEIDDILREYIPYYDEMVCEAAEQIVASIVKVTDGLSILNEYVKDNYESDYFIPVNNVIGPVTCCPGLLSDGGSRGVSAYYEQVYSYLNSVLSGKRCDKLIVLGGVGYKLNDPGHLSSNILYVGDCPDPLFYDTFLRRIEDQQAFEAVCWDEWKNGFIRGHRTFYEMDWNYQVLYGPLPISSEAYKLEYGLHEWKNMVTLMSMDQYAKLMEEPYLVLSSRKKKVKGKMVRQLKKANIQTTFLLLDPGTEVGLVVTNYYARKNFYPRYVSETNGGVLSGWGAVSSNDTDLFQEGRKVIVQYIRWRLESQEYVRKYRDKVRYGGQLHPSVAGWEGDENHWAELWGWLCLAFGRGSEGVEGRDVYRVPGIS